MEAIGTIIGLFGIFTCLPTFKVKVDDAIAAIGAPKSPSFYFLVFWALVAAVLGGLIWGFFQQVIPGPNLWSLDSALDQAASELGAGWPPKT